MSVSEQTSSTGARGRRALAAGLVGALLAGLLGWVLAPAPSTPGPQTTGDPALAERLRAEAGPGRYGLVAAVVRDGRVTVAGIGEDGHGNPVGSATPFEVGSVTKTFTGAVLAELERRGQVRADDRVRDVLPAYPWRPGGAGEVTLAELATHHSGLPRTPGGIGELARGVVGASPYGNDVEDVLAAADRAELAGRGEHHYSNLGSALLGHALAERAGTPYPQLVDEVVARPLGMTGTAVLDAPPPGAARSHDLAGRPQPVWLGEGDAPAGIGVWSTVDDLVRYAGALGDPSSPVAVAAQPRAGSEFGRIGYGWNVLDADGRTLLWKNGGVSGTSSTVLAEPTTGDAVVVLGNTERPVDALAVRLLDVPSPFPGSDGGAADLVRAWLPVLVGTLFPLMGGLTTLSAALGGWAGRERVNRVEFVGTAGTGLFFLAITFAGGGVSWWLVLPWMVGCLTFGAGLGTAAARWRGWDATGGAARWAGTVFGLALGLGMTVAVAVVTLGAL
ncbi:serine hydrolase [Pseudonocardia sp. NPDC049635]|uniref:serine hydrolase n=1 Tax=Pseudonocardia sp. NPDC049635 TaxID=3155506 RepID=UPI0033EDCEB4